MRNKLSTILLGIFFAVILALSACKKDSPANKTNTTTTSGNPAAIIGLFEAGDGTNNRIYIPLSKIGTKTVSYDEVFDSGSNGLTIDAHGIIPDSLITTNGFSFTGDSVVINGITITSHVATVAYGNKTSSIKEYGNLAYASVTIPNNGSAAVTIARVPMFLYYKIVDGNNKQQPTHSGDVFGVGPGLSAASPLIASPLSYYKLSTGITSGFKLALLKNADFVSGGTYETAIVTLGLTTADLNSSGFIMHPLSIINPGGYSSEIPSTISYQGNNIAAQVIFDTGTPSVTIIEDKTASSIGNLPASTQVTVTTNKGFVYQYTTASSQNLTAIENPVITGDYRTVFSIDFFVDNEFLTDYAGHQIGLKNN